MKKYNYYLLTLAALVSSLYANGIETETQEFDVAMMPEPTPENPNPKMPQPEPGKMIIQ